MADENLPKAEAQKKDPALVRAEVIKEFKKTEDDFLNDMKSFKKGLELLLSTVWLSLPDRLLLQYGNSLINRLVDFDDKGTVTSKLIPNFIQEQKGSNQDPASLLAADVKTVKAKEFFAANLDYANYYLVILNLIKKLRTENEKVNDALEKFKYNSEEIKGLEKMKGLDLNDYLIKPMQRLQKYPLLLKEIIKNTPEDQLTDWNEAKKVIEDSISGIDQAKSNDNPDRAIVVNLLQQKAKNTIQELITSLSSLGKSTEILIVEIEKRANNPDLGMAEKLSQIKREMREKGYREAIVLWGQRGKDNARIFDTIKNQFENDYVQFKEAFSKQVVDININAIKKLTEPFEKEIQEQDKKDKEKTKENRGYKPDYKNRLQQYQEIIDKLKVESGLRKQSVKQNKENISFLKMVDKKIENYSKNLGSLQKEVNKEEIEKQRLAEAEKERQQKVEAREKQRLTKVAPTIPSRPVVTPGRQGPSTPPSGSPSIGKAPVTPPTGKPVAPALPPRSPQQVRGPVTTTTMPPDRQGAPISQRSPQLGRGPVAPMPGRQGPSTPPSGSPSIRKAPVIPTTGKPVASALPRSPQQERRPVTTTQQRPTQTNPRVTTTIGKVSNQNMWQKPQQGRTAPSKAQDDKIQTPKNSPKKQSG